MLRSWNVLFLASAMAVGCAAQPDGPVIYGDKSVEDIQTRLEALIADGELSAEDVRELFSSDVVGDAHSTEEMLLIRDAVEHDGSEYVVADDARQQALDLAIVANLSPQEREVIESGMTYAGVPMPDEVRKLLAEARLNGAFAYDIREMEETEEQAVDPETQEPLFDEGGAPIMRQKGVWTRYFDRVQPIENMAFDYTFISNEVVQADLNDTDVTYNQLVGSHEECQDPNDRDTCGRVADFEERTGGTGHVLVGGDQAYWSDIYARGMQGQRWTNNCAILSDGSLHCLPASRRAVIRPYPGKDVTQPAGFELTNPALARCHPADEYESCRHLLYNGHISIRAGRVSDVEMSGHIWKNVAKGRAYVVDPIAFLEAWGFDVDHINRIAYDWHAELQNPVRDLERHVVVPAVPAN